MNGSTAKQFFFKVFICQFFTWILWPYYILRSRYPNWEHRAAITPNSIATNGGGVCQYDITNATANYDAVSMTTLGHQFKDKQIIIATWMHHMCSKKNGKRGKKPRKVYGPHNCRASTFITENNQCRGCRCNRYKVHTCTELIKITMNGNGHNNSINSNLIIKQLWMNSIFNQLLDNAFL